LTTGAERLLLLLGLSLFFGFAFEGFYAGATPRRPGGVRTFPMLALAGGGLYLVDERYAAAFIAGLFVVGSWTYAYLRAELSGDLNVADGAFIVPACNVLAYVLGALALTQPLWLCVAVAVLAVLLLGSRRKLHEWVQFVPAPEVVTAGQFLLLVGVILPLLSGRPALPYTSITPFGIWLAVVAVSSISYASYLLERYVFPQAGTLLSSIVGGLYSSTATTVVLARRSREGGMLPDSQAGIVAATAMMYLRILVVTALFNLTLARMLALPLVALAAIAALMAAERARLSAHAAEHADLTNPLQLSTAFVFALLFVAVSMIANFAQHTLGHTGVLVLAGIVGITDIDPFVLSLAQGGAAGVGLTTAAMAILIASSSNNVVKASYTVLFSRRRESAMPAAMLVALAVLGAASSFALFR